MRRPIRTERGYGFTLLELVHSIAVVGILAAILFPVFAQARERARQSTCRSNLHQIGLALQMYARDHDGRLPADHNDFKPIIGEYVNALAIFRCPSEANPVLSPGASAARPRSEAFNGPTYTGGNPNVAPLPPGPYWTDYQYRGGLTLESRGDELVAGEWAFRHSGAAQVLTLAGDVRAVPAERFKAFAPGVLPPVTVPGPNRPPGPAVSGPDLKNPVPTLNPRTGKEADR